MQRRSFFKWAIHGLGALFGAVLGIPAVAYLIDARNRPARQSSYKTVARLSELAINEPKQVVVTDVRTDAWTLHPSDVVGRVWLVRREDNSVDAYTTICPHLGCSINFDEQKKQFVCPCHGGYFDIHGKRLEEPGKINPAPRDMDRLEQLHQPPDSDAIQVLYQEFQQGKHDRVVKS